MSQSDKLSIERIQIVFRRHLSTGAGYSIINGKVSGFALLGGHYYYLELTLHTSYIVMGQTLPKIKNL